MKAPIDYIILVLILVINTSSSSTKEVFKQPIKEKHYTLELNKEKICSKDKYLENKILELEKENEKFLSLKQEIQQTLDSTWHP